MVPAFWRWRSTPPASTKPARGKVPGPSPMVTLTMASSISFQNTVAPHVIPSRS